VSSVEVCSVGATMDACDRIRRLSQVDMADLRPRSRDGSPDSGLQVEPKIVPAGHPHCGHGVQKRVRQTSAVGAVDPLTEGENCAV
jgi:hypothetical protein